MILRRYIIKGLLIGAGVVAVIIFFNSRVGGCPVEKEIRDVRGSSLGAELPEGTQVVLLRGYYDCHSPERGDIIGYKASGYADEVVIKSARGIPGDTFGVATSTAGNLLFINGETAQTFDGHPYLLSDNRYKFWKSYKKAYRGVVPPNSYILLGNIPGGSVDSILYGFIAKSQLIGKIER